MKLVNLWYVTVNEKHQHDFQWVIKVKRRIADSAYWASRREVLPFSPPFSQSTVEVIETQGQRSRQLRMRECMHSFKACHINDTSEQFQKGLKKEKLKPYPQPSRSEILANQERRRNRSGKRGNMGRWVDCGVSTYRHYNILRHLATECVLLQRSELFFFCFVFFFNPVITNWDWFVF